MASNEELQAQVDALRDALGAIAGMQVATDQDVTRLTNRLKIWVGPKFKGALNRFDELRGPTD